MRLPPSPPRYKELSALSSDIDEPTRYNTNGVLESGFCRIIRIKLEPDG